jgi:hypothetical protein
MAVEHFVITPYTIYRRSDILIKCEFDLDKSESSIHQEFMSLRIFDYIINELTPERTAYPTTGTAMEKTTLDDGSSYWSLVAKGGWFEYSLDEEHNPHSLFEVMYDYSNPGIGQLDLWVNGVTAETRKGPSTWASSAPHKAIDGVVIRGRQRNFGLSDPPPRGELDNLCIYKYDLIDCEMAQYTPPKATGTPKAIDTLRGHSNYQTTQYIGTQIDMSLRFSSAKAHTDFLVNADAIHVVCDDKGVFYRGVLELGEPKRLGVDLYEQGVAFKSPNKLGEGWK